VGSRETAGGKRSQKEKKGNQKKKRGPDLQGSEKGWKKRKNVVARNCVAQCIVKSKVQKLKRWSLVGGGPSVKEAHKGQVRE